MGFVFLSLADVLQLHSDQIDHYGGEVGVRDQGLLESALAQPVATFDRQRLRADLFEMAAAYLFHIVQNHPFVDRNKRAGVVAALVFLMDNSIEIEAEPGELYELTMSVARSDAGKTEVTEFFRHHAH
ncbi:MAG: type II toxin-antitoxin system death-on-curing family toxin [Phycisphaerales bacterium]|nr:type II toxin-antitoxin system death-on-curing family toxin [Phycisphaerales bacterium]